MMSSRRRSVKRSYVEPPSDEDLSEHLSDSDEDPTWGPDEKEDGDEIYVPQKKRGRPSKTVKTTKPLKNSTEKGKSSVKTATTKTSTPTTTKTSAPATTTTPNTTPSSTQKPTEKGSLVRVDTSSYTVKKRVCKTEGEGSKLKRGDFIVKTKDLPLTKSTALWKVDSGYLMQRYEAVADNKTSRLLYQSCLTFSSCLDAGDYTLVDTKVTSRNRNILTVEVLKVHEDVEVSSTTGNIDTTSQKNKSSSKADTPSTSHGVPDESKTTSRTEKSKSVLKDSDSDKNTKKTKSFAESFQSFISGESPADDDKTMVTDSADDNSREISSTSTCAAGKNSPSSSSNTETVATTTDSRDGGDPPDTDAADAPSENDPPDADAGTASENDNSPESSEEEGCEEAMFHIYVQILLSQALEPEFMTALRSSDEEGSYYLKPLEAIDHMIEQKKNTVNLSIGSRFLNSLKKRPYVKILNPRGVQHSPGKGDSVVKTIQLYGDPYHEDKLTSIDSSEETNVEEFMIVGDPAAECVRGYHELHHFKHSLYLSCIEKIKMQKNAGGNGLDLLEQCLKDQNWLKTEYKKFKKMF